MSEAGRVSDGAATDERASYARLMLPEDDRPIGAPILAERRRDRLSVWVAEHRWAVPSFRLAGGLSLVAVTALVFRAGLPWDKVVAFVVGAALGGGVAEREKERGDALRRPPDSLPREFTEYFAQPPATESDGRYYRPRHM
jgi:hypothetical protein